MYSPILHENPFIRCVILLFSPKKVFTYCLDGFDICAQTGERIMLPYAYYSTITRMLYALVGCGVAVVMSILPYLEMLVGILLLVLFHHMCSAIILGCFTWTPIDPSIKNIQDFGKMAKEDAGIKGSHFVAGFMFAFGLLILA